MATSVSDIVKITTPEEPIQIGLSAMSQNTATSARTSKRKVTRPIALSGQTTNTSQVSVTKVPGATGPFSRGFSNGFGKGSSPFSNGFSGGFGNNSSGTSPFSGGFSNGFGRP